MEYRFALPDLSRLRPQAPSATFLRVFRRDPNPRWAVALVVTYLRSVDLAVVEYGLCRRACKRIERGEEPKATRSGAAVVRRGPDGGFIVSGLVAATSFPVRILRAVGHMETCITATARALRLLNALHSLPNARDLRVPSERRVAPGGLAHRLDGLRNAVEHAYGDIKRDRETGVHPDFGADLEPEAVEYRGISVSYEELAACLRSLVAFGRTLVIPP